MTPRVQPGAPRDPSPYRDDRPALLAENARLRRELSRLRRRRAWPAFAGLVAYLAVLVELRGWLNGADPVRYWTALVALALAFCVGVAGAVHLIVGGRD